MMPGYPVEPLAWTSSPQEVLRRWPADAPLAALASNPRLGEHPTWARWSYFAAPEAPVTLDARDPNILQTLHQTVGLPGVEVGAGPVPFAGGWIVALGYELGRQVEPAAAAGATRTDESWPWPVVLWRCPALLAYDHHDARWWSVGDTRAVRDAIEMGSARGGTWTLSEPTPARPREEFLSMVRRGVEYIHAGDCFQVNLSHRIGATFSGSPRALFEEMLRAAAPWYGAYLEVAGGEDLHAALSVSPELFLELDASTREVVTRPIKGTRPGHAPAADLLASAKDQAELAMIIDLMRNDLGRVCEVGSVRVETARTIERHGSGASGGTGVQHGVATIRGRVRPGTSIATLIGATFPGGSITGAPKVRAMQIIEELEPTPRGLYTGAIGYVADTGNIALNIAIRTAVVHGHVARTPDGGTGVHDGRLVYGAGAGIVADSVPEEEWQETLDKAGVLRALSGGFGPATVSTRRSSSVQERVP